MAYAENINFIFTYSKKLKCNEICFLCDEGFGERKENIKWLEYEVKFEFSVKPTHFQINFIVKLIPRPPKDHLLRYQEM